MTNARIVRCPSCGKSTRYDEKNPDRPFCSARCRTIDIAQWADENYRIPVKQSFDDEGESALREGADDEAND